MRNRIQKYIEMLGVENRQVCEAAISLSVRLEAINSLGYASIIDDVPQALVQALCDEDEKMRLQALLWLCPTSSRTILPEVIEALRDDHMQSMISQKLSDIHLRRIITPLISEALNDLELCLWVNEMMNKINTEKGCRR